MEDLVRQFVLDHVVRDLGAVDKIASKFKYLEVRQNRYILRRGEICRRVYFVMEGCLQSYIYDPEDQETTRDIVTEGHWYSDLRSFLEREPSIENVRTIEFCRFFYVEREDFLELLDTVPSFAKAYQRQLEIYYAGAAFRLNIFISLSALERMRWLLQQKPSLFTRLSNKILASYLGINKDVFSRLKPKL